MDVRSHKKVQKNGKIFRPCKVPRYLPKALPEHERMADLQFYNVMMRKIFYAKPIVDDKPPKTNVYNYINLRLKVRQDAMRLQQIDVENKILMKKINHINRMGGKVDSFNPQAFATCSRWKTHRTKMLKIAKDNILFYHRLKAVVSNYPSVDFDRDWRKNVEKMKHMAKYTLQMFVTRSVDQLVNEMPSLSVLKGDPESRKKRPCCFINFRIKDGIPMGRIIVELYNDVVPQTCQNFLSICKGTKGLKYESCRVYNVVRGQYFETGDVTLNNGKGGCSIFGEQFPEEGHILKHTKPGVLSMVPVNKTYNNSKFSITFNTLEQMDRKRVVFGRVVKGMKTIYHIQDLGRKVGAPIVPIIIEKCGEIKYYKKLSNSASKGNIHNIQK